MEMLNYAKIPRHTDLSMTAFKRTGIEVLVASTIGLRPDQLQPGTLADSQNGRMGTNGQWQVRKGVDTLLSPVAVSATALSLPFNLDDSGTSS